jgi:hypothetical protein
LLRRLSAAYFAGALGAVVASLALWVASQAGLLERLGVGLDSPLSWAWLSPRILWGGLWGLGFPAVLRRGLSPVRAGLVLSLAPSVAQLFYFFPRHGGQLLGVAHGPLTPLVVLAVNAIWGWTLARVVLAVGEAGAPAEK